MIFILLHLSAGLVQISPFPNNFYLAQNEYETLELGEYFSGDLIRYTINPESPQIQLSQSTISVRSSSTYNYELIPPDRVTLMKNLNQYESPITQFSIYSNNNVVYLLSTNPIRPVELKTILHEIYWFSVTQSGMFNGVLLLARSKLINKNLLYFASLSFIGNQLVLNDPSLLKDNECFYKEFNPKSMYLSDGILKNNFLVTGYIENRAYLGLYTYNIGSLSGIKELSVIELGHASAQEMIFAIVVIYDYYVYFPETQQLAKYRMPTKKLEIISSVYLTEYNITVVSIELSFDFNYLLLGLIDGFMVISLDFFEVYIKKITNTNSKIYLTSSDKYFYFLVQNNSQYSLTVTSSYKEFNIIANLALNRSDTSIGWGIFNTTLTSFSLLCNYKFNLEIYNIIVSTPFLSIASDQGQKNFMLTATESLTGRSIFNNFSISAPYSLGLVESIVFSAQNAVFDGLKAEVSIRIYDYYCGYCLELQNLNISKDLDYFNMSYIYSLTIYDFNIEANFETSAIIGMLSADDSVYFYSNDSTYFFINHHLDLIAEYDFIIHNLDICGYGYLVNLTHEGINKFAFSYDLNSFSLGQSFVSEGYYKFQCTEEYIVFQNTSGLYIYIFEDYKTGPAALNTTSDGNSIKISYFHLYSTSYICAVVNDSVILLFDINLLNSFPINIPLKSVRIKKNSINIYCNSQYYYIAYEDNTIQIYNNYGQYMKAFDYQNNGLIYFTSNYIFSITDTLLQVFNSTGAICGILIAEYFLPPVLYFSYYDSTDLIITLLQESGNLLVLTVPANHSTAFLTFTFSNPEKISRFNYTAYLDMNISNSLNSVSESIPINIFTNGETIYKNEKSIEKLQDDIEEIDCSATQFSLNDLFLGQDLTLRLESDSKMFNIEQSIAKKSFNSLENISFSAFLSVQFSDIYLFANKNIIILFDKDLLEGKGTIILDDNNTVNCISFSVLYDFEKLIFVTGCEIQSLDDLTYQLYFLEYKDNVLNVLTNISIPYKPSLMHSQETVGGLFALIISDTIKNFQEYSFACNHLQIILGNVENSSVKIYLQKYMNPLDLGLNYYYIVDFSSYYDPMFATFYFYLLDWYYGIRIIRIDQLHPTLLLEINNIELSQGVALTRCGKELYVSTDNTTVLRYYLANWFKPKYSTTIFLYKNNFHAIPSTLKCSSPFYSKFLIMLLKNNSDYIYLHVMNNKVQALSSILADSLVSNTLTGTYAFMDQSNKIIVITASESYLYTINEFVLNINPPDKCDSDIHKDIRIYAQNENNIISDCSISIKISKNYNSGNVSDDGVPQWLWGLIILIVLIFVVVGIIVTKRYFLRKTKKADKDHPGLFNYELIDGIN